MTELYRQDYFTEDRANQVKGYVRIPKPSWFTGNPNDSYVLEHHVICCQANFITEIPDGMCVHHKNRKRWDNHPSNLQMLTDAEHRTLHMEEDREIKKRIRKENAEKKAQVLAQKHAEKLRRLQKRYEIQRQGSD